MPITDVQMNWKGMIFGGSGAVIPFDPRRGKPSGNSSENEGSNSHLPKEYLDQIAAEARERWGASPSGKREGEES